VLFFSTATVLSKLAFSNGSFTQTTSGKTSKRQIPFSTLSKKYAPVPEYSTMLEFPTPAISLSFLVFYGIRSV
jgi:hypothetical protein